MQEKAKSDGLEKVLAMYEMTGDIPFIKEIAGDKLIVSDLRGKTSIVWKINLIKVHSLDIGSGYGSEAWSACVYQNLLFVGNSNGIHIFDARRNYQKLE